MKFKELTELEFSKFALNHEQRNFYQTVEWGELKETNNWEYHFVGVTDDKDNIIGASLLLSKKIISKYKMFYAPRGFLIDYSNYDLVSFFTKEIKKYLRNKNAIFIKIDPNLICKERDINGDIVEGGIDNSLVVKTLKKLNYKHTGFNKELGKTIQPRWHFTINIEDMTLDTLLKNMDQQTRWAINKTLKLPFEVRYLTEGNIEIFGEIMKHTGKRRSFFSRPLSYYKDMYNILKKSNMIKIILVELNVLKYMDFLNGQLENEFSNMKNIEEKLKDIPKSKKFNKQLNVINENIELLNKKIEEANNLKSKYKDKIEMAASMFITYGDEITYLYSGAYRDFMHFNPQYRIQWEMLKYGIENKYKIYNMSGISGNFDKKDPLYGIYLFKRGFNGQVVELIGEFDLVINSLFYYGYKLLFKLYKLVLKFKRGNL